MEEKYFVKMPCDFNYVVIIIEVSLSFTYRENSEIKVTVKLTRSTVVMRMIVQIYK